MAIAQRVAHLEASPGGRPSLGSRWRSWALYTRHLSATNRACVRLQRRCSIPQLSRLGRSELSPRCPRLRADTISSCVTEHGVARAATCGRCLLLSHVLETQKSIQALGTAPVAMLAPFPSNKERNGTLLAPPYKEALHPVGSRTRERPWQIPNEYSVIVFRNSLRRCCKTAGLSIPSAEIIRIQAFTADGMLHAIGS